MASASPTSKSPPRTQMGTDSVASSEQPAERPLQVISMDRQTKKFELNMEALSSILLHPSCRKHPVAVVSVAGPFRMGKSFLLNFFIRYLSSSTEDEDPSDEWLREDASLLDGFKWRSGVEPETSGIWMWSRPFLRRIPGSNKMVAVLLVDTQGTFDNKSTMKENTTIFALNALLSSFQVYNVQKLIREDKLQQMHLFTKFGEFVHDMQQKGADEPRKPFQTLQFLVRDWSTPKDYPFGAEGGDNYLNRVLSTEGGEENEELRNVRSQIRACFEDLHCYLMPHPGLEVAEDGDFRGEVSTMRQQFVTHLRDFVPLVLSRQSLVVKQICGVDVTCEALLTYFQAYVDLFKLGEVPEVADLFRSTAMANYASVKLKARDQYVQQMQAACGPGRPFIEQSDLDKIHTEALAESMKAFTETRKLNFPELEEKVQAELLEELETLYAEYAEANRSKHILSSLRTPIVLGALSLACNILCTLLGVLGLSTFAFIFSNLTWVALITIALWGYCVYTGSYPDVVVEIDNLSRIIFELVQEHVLTHILGPQVAAMAGTKKAK